MNTAWFLSIPAMMFPNQEILVFEDTRLTYAQLQERVNRLANALRSLDLGRGSLIGVLQTNCNQYVEAYYACSKVGGAFVPLNYRASHDELKYMVNAAEIDALLVGERYFDLTSSLCSQLPSVKHWIALGRPHEGMLFFDDLVNDKPADDVVEEAMEGDEANILMYTSVPGSLPKAVVLTYSNLIEYIFGTVERANGRTGGTTLLAAPPYHSAGITAIISSMYGGRRLVLMRRFDAKEWLRLVERERVTHAFLAPEGLKRLLHEPDLAETDLSSLETVSYGVAPMPLTCLAPLKLATHEATLSCGTTQIPDIALAQALERLLENGPITAFGLGDTISRVTTLLPRDHRLDGSAEEIEKKLVRLSSIGRVVPNIELKIVGEDGQEVPRGDIGEIMVRALRQAGCSPGDEGIRSEVAGGGWVRTRELGWIDEDGYVFLAGRKDGLVIGNNEKGTTAGNLDAVLLYPDVQSEVLPQNGTGKIENRLVLRETHLGRLRVDDLLRFLNAVYESLDLERLRTNYLSAIQSLVPASAYGFHLLDSEIDAESPLSTETDRDCFVYADVRGLQKLESLTTCSVWTRYDSEDGRPAPVNEWRRRTLHEIVGKDSPIHFVQAPVVGTKRRLLATLSFVRSGEHHPFESVDLRVIRVIAQHMGTVLRNALKHAQLYENYQLAVGALQLTGTAVIVSDMDGRIRFANFEARKRIGQDSSDATLISLVRARLRDNLLEMKSSGKRIVTSTVHLPGRFQLHRESLALRSVQLPSAHRAAVTFLYNLEQAPNFQHLTPPLSKREIEVLELVAKGMHNKDIAESLVVTTNTVKQHLKQIFLKMEVSSRYELLVKAFSSLSEGEAVRE